MNKKRIIQWIAVAGGLLLVACGIFFLRPKTGEMTLVNESDEAIIKATVQINHQKFDLAGIPPGGIWKVKF